MYSRVSLAQTCCLLSPELSRGMCASPPIFVKVQCSKKLLLGAMSIIFPPRSRTRAIVFPSLLIVPLRLGPGLNRGSLWRGEMD